MIKLTPSKQEYENIKQATSSLKAKVDSVAKKYHAKLLIGGSIGKDTWLAGISDIDCFLLFNYQKYKNKSNKLSDITEKILKQAKIRANRVHGSRDYFQFMYNKFQIEIIPVLEIKNMGQALNITDASPLHLKWLKKHQKQSPKLSEEIRNAKQFLKAQKLYGAESYILGLSGHATEILVTHYKAFSKFVKNVTKWGAQTILDPKKHYKSSSEIKKSINPEKKGPLILIDPVDKKRNAAAALSKKNYKLLIKAATHYSKNPSEKFFREKDLTIQDLKKIKTKNKLFILSKKPRRGKTDIIGSKLLKNYKKLLKEFRDNDFDILKQNWQWSPWNKALFWFETQKNIPKTKIHYGPPLNAAPQNIKNFKKKYPKAKTKNKRLYIPVKRKHTDSKKLLSKLLKDFKGFKIEHA
jgi:tRNA nucleotidyltransferase (CCA-adding enzyme)